MLRGTTDEASGRESLALSDVTDENANDNHAESEETAEAEYDADGFDADGYDAEGFDRDGFDADGYDADGNPADWLNESDETQESGAAQARETRAPSQNLSQFAALAADLNDEEREVINTMVAEGNFVDAMQSLIHRAVQRERAGSALTSLRVQHLAEEAPEFYREYAPGIQMALSRMGSGGAAREEALPGAVMGAILADALTPQSDGQAKGWKQALLDAADRLRKETGSGKREAARNPEREVRAPQRPPQPPRVAPTAGRKPQGASSSGRENNTVSRVARTLGMSEKETRRLLQQEGRI